ncbi:MAG: putative DNA binding domain-containing protein [Nitrospirae bacterium]|nr:putative DNA binding domain-containing protein [Nitrospirota bacterium]
MVETLIKEYKSIKKIRTGTADFKDLAKTCVCLANAQGGEIYIGFEDKTHLPTPDQKVSENEINDTVKKLRSLAFSVNIHHSQILKHSNGGEYFIITVQPSIKSIATTSDGKIYIRAGEECLPAHNDDIYRIAAEKQAFQWELVVHDSIALEDVNPEEINQFAKDIRDSDKVKPFIKAKSDIEILEHYTLIDNGKLTNLGVLWLGYPKQRMRLAYPITVQYVVYDRLDKKIRKETWTDCQFNPKHLLLDIESKATELKYFHEFPHGLFRKRIRHYSDKVIRELLINAFAHHIFTISSDIMIEVYPDRLVISSPGGLPLGINKNNILHQRHRRNPHFINIFHDIGLMEGEGSGFDMIYEELSRDVKPFPDIESDFNHVAIIQQSRILNEEDLAIMDYITHHFELSQKEFIALGIIIRHKKILAPRLSRGLQLADEDRLRTWVAKLTEKEMIITRGSKKGTAYLLNPKLLSGAKLNIKPTLKTIETHALKALIIEDLKIHPMSSVSQIFERLHKEVPREDVQKAVYALIKDGDIEKEGPRAKTVYFLAKKK